MNQSFFQEEIYERYLAGLLTNNRQQCRQSFEQWLEVIPELRTIYEDLVRRSLYEVGELWEQGKISVATEHLATAICESLLNLTYPRLFAQPRNGKSAVVTCVANEYHQIGGKMMADIFELNGWRGYFLGANLPVDAVKSFIEEKQPDVVALSVATIFNLDQLLRVDPALPDEPLLEAHPALKPILYARLTVTDTGQGMNAKTLERIFEPFFTTKPVGRGTGLGLAVVHGIVEAHKGVITVESQVGQGTTFRLYFPAETKTETLTATVAKAISHGSGQKILAVDDEPALTSMLQKMLGRLDYQVTTSNQPREAIHWVRENPAQFDLVITDLTMPEMNGLEVAKQLHAIRPDLPVILVSGYSVSVGAERLREAGICERLDKPVSPAVLGEVLARVLKKV